MDYTQQYSIKTHLKIDTDNQDNANVVADSNANKTFNSFFHHDLLPLET